jgi:hypothetical protein
VASLKETENLIRNMISTTFRLSGEKILAIAVIYPSTRKSPPSQELVSDLVKDRYNISPDFSSSQSTTIVMRKMNPDTDLGIERNPGDALAPMLARTLKDRDLRSCNAVAYRDFDDTLNAWTGALFIGIVAQS